MPASGTSLPAGRSVPRAHGFLARRWMAHLQGVGALCARRCSRLSEVLVFVLLVFELFVLNVGLDVAAGLPRFAPPLSHRGACFELMLFAKPFVRFVGVSMLTLFGAMVSGPRLVPSVRLRVQYVHSFSSAMTVSSWRTA